MSGSRDSLPTAVPAGWTRLPDGRTVPAGDWAAGPNAGPAGLVCVRGSDQQPVFQGVLEPDGTVALLDGSGHRLGAGTFAGDGRSLQVTLTDGSTHTLDLAGTTLQVSGAHSSSAFSVGADGHLHAATALAPTGGELVVTTADGQTIPLSQWLQQGPMVIAPDGRRMTENAFAYTFGENPNDPWVAVRDASGANRMEHLSQFLAPGPDNPVVVTPDGKSMTVNAFFHSTGANPADWITYKDDRGRTVITTRSDFAQQGPIVMTPGGQQVHEGRFVLDNPAPAGRPWVFVPYQDRTLVMSATDFQASVDDMMSLSDSLWFSAGDVRDVLVRLESELSQVDCAFNGLNDDDGREQLIATFNGPGGTWATLLEGFRTLAQSLDTMSDGLTQSARVVVAMEQANVEGFQFTLPPASRRRNTNAV
jgi:hypothetical protein